jgi:PEP-CTERM motif
MRHSTCSAVLLFAMLLAARSASATIISFDPLDQNVTAGTSTSVAVTIAGLGNSMAPSLGTFDLDVGFDPGILRFTSASYGDPTLGDQLDLSGLGSIIITTPYTSSVNLLELSLDVPADIDSLQSDSFILAILNFDPIGTGVSSLGLTLNALGDADGYAVDASVRDARVTVESPTVSVPEPSTASLLIVGLAGLLTLRKHRIL